MSRFKLMGLIWALILCVTLDAWGEPIKLFVQEFKVSGVNVPDDMKSTLSSLFSSRIDGDIIQVVETAAQADGTASGAYSAIGKMFSLDLQVKDISGKSILRAFEQGESADDVIPSVGRLAQKITKELAKIKSTPAIKLPADKDIRISDPVIKTTNIDSAVIKPTVVVTPSSSQGEIVRPDIQKKAAESGMIGQRLDGAMIAIAPGKKLPGGDRELFMALEREIRLYRQGKEIVLLTSISDFRATEKIIGIDTADLDNDGKMELYVTMTRGEKLASQVWVVESDKFNKIASDLPYFFRAVSVGNGKRKVLAQEMGSDVDFSMEIGEVFRKGNSVEVKPFKRLAAPISIFTIGWIEAGAGKNYLVQLSEDGYLLVRDEKNEELWRSSDRFGGAELFFSREDQQNVRVTGELHRKVYLDQRIIVASDGELIVPRSDGLWSSGPGRTFSKNSIYSFAWNGAVLDERWHTRESRHYLADYFYDEDKKELVLLEVIKKDGMIQKGASAISIKKIE